MEDQKEVVKMNNDLISRSELVEELRFKRVAVYGSGSMKDIGKVIESVETAPAIDAEPVRHGKWIDDMYFDEPITRCTACKCGFTKGHKAERFRYCPNCGAKMDTEVSE